MIKFTIENGDDSMIGVGLSYENLKILKKGKPISVDLSELGIPGYELFIFAGETEQSMVDNLKSYIGPETKFHRFKDESK